MFDKIINVTIFWWKHTPEGIICLFSCYMRGFVCWLTLVTAGPGRVPRNNLIFHIKQLPAAINNARAARKKSQSREGVAYEEIKAKMLSWQIKGITPFISTVEIWLISNLKTSMSAVFFLTFSVQLVIITTCAEKLGGSIAPPLHWPGPR